LQARMREMVTRMVEAGNTSLFDTYYDPGFLLTANGRTQDLAAFRAEHDRAHRTGITYAVTYDEESWVEGRDRIAGRLWISMHRPGGQATRIEVLFVATYRFGRILRLTKLTGPDLTPPDAPDT
jgi:hypothetical protein